VWPEGAVCGPSKEQQACQLFAHVLAFRAAACGAPLWQTSSPPALVSAKIWAKRRRLWLALVSFACGPHTVSTIAAAAHLQPNGLGLGSVQPLHCEPHSLEGKQPGPAAWSGCIARATLAGKPLAEASNQLKKVGQSRAHVSNWPPNSISGGGCTWALAVGANLALISLICLQLLAAGNPLEWPVWPL